MNQLNSINNISSLLSRFVVQVKGLNAINQYGINFLSETVLIPLFKEIFNYTELINLNTTENKNFPGVDIADYNQRVAFQITSNADLEKVKHTLKQFSDFSYYLKFDKLFIYSITEKSKISVDKDLSDLTKNNYSFSISENLIDYKDLLKLINGIEDYDKILRIENLLAKQFSEIRIDQYKQQIETSLNETVYSNLLHISLPSVIYTARITVKRKDLKNKRVKIFNDRELIFQFKKENKLRFSADWIDFQKQMYSFHDLSNPHHQISEVIDIGTVEKFEPEEFYLQSKDHEKAFKALLKFCFTKYANFLDIEFNHEENLFVFRCAKDSKIVRKESWNSGKRSASRNVVKIKLHKERNSIWYYTHLAFSVGFKFYDSKWFLEITPDWFVTKDGVNKHFKMNKEVTSWLKRQERNLHVFNNTKFIVNFLKYGKMQGELFEIQDINRPKNFLDFLNLETFKNSPFLNEDAWKVQESDEVIDLMADKEGNIDIES